VVKLLNDKNVLVVDDEIEILNILEFFLSKEFKNVYKSQDAFSALEFIYKSNKKVDVILLDVMMPILDGFQIAKILKMQREYNKIPIIMLSALGEDANIKKGFLVGADDYIVKPARKDTIIETVSKVIRKNENLNSSGRVYNIKFELKSDFEYIKEINNMAKWIFSNTGAEEMMVSDLVYSLNEMCANAIEHGNRSDKNKNVFVECDVYSDKAVVSIKDEGRGFNPEDTLERLEGADMYRLRGRGMIITRQLIDNIEYVENGKQVVMTKFFNKIKTAGD
jgi:DNA-binding response OmpR family regulator